MLCLTVYGGSMNAKSPSRARSIVTSKSQQSILTSLSCAEIAVKSSDGNKTLFFVPLGTLNCLSSPVRLNVYSPCLSYNSPQTRNRVSCATLTKAVYTHDFC